MPNFATVASPTFHELVLAATSKTASKSSGTTSIILLVAIVGIGYFLLIRPQRQRARRAQQQNKNVAVGDEVMLSSGIFGRVTGMEGDRANVEIAPDIEIEVVTRAIAQRIEPAADIPVPEPVTPDPAGDEDEDFAHASDDPGEEEDEVGGGGETTAHEEGLDTATAWPPTAVKPADNSESSVPSGGIAEDGGSGRSRRFRRETS